MTIPIIDISPVLNLPPSNSSQSFSSSGRHYETSKALIQALSVNGYAGVTGHGLTPELINPAFSFMKEFFALPHEVKMEAAARLSEGEPPRGFAPAGAENAAKASTEREGFQTQEANIADYKVCLGCFRKCNSEMDTFQKETCLK
jgi:isopenicillin N synthase-like dioxygenase